MKDQKLLNLPECAKAIGAPVGWLKDKANAGKVPCIRFRKRKYLFNLNAVRRTLAEMAAEAKEDNHEQ